MADKPVPWTVHADSSKPHRCPNCWLVSGWVPWKTVTCHSTLCGKRAKTSKGPWSSELRNSMHCTCNEPGCPGGCGQKYASRPWLGYKDQPPGHPVLYTLQKARNAVRVARMYWQMGSRRRAALEILVPHTITWWRTQRYLRKLEER